MRTSFRVLLLQSHPGDGHSMARYSSHLARYYRTRGVNLRCVRPTDQFSRAVGRRWKKQVMYIEKLLLFPAALLLLRLGRRPDVVHIADHSNAPWALHAPGRSRLVITVHDLIAQRAALGELPEHQPRRPGRIYQSMIRVGLRRADDLVSVSETTRRDAERLFPRAQHHVAYNWVDLLKGRTRDVSPASRHVLIVSTAGWRKTRWRAIEIAVRVADELKAGCAILLVGPRLTGEELDHLDRAGIDPGRVTLRSGVEEDTLQQLYSSAVCLVQASRYEGFGWPIIEANAHGVPVIAADEPIFREIAGRARYVSDLATTDWSAISRWMTSTEAAADARRNAQRFTFLEASTALDTALGLRRHEQPSAPSGSPQ